MAIVSFWTEDDKETGQTSTAIAVATGIHRKDQGHYGRLWACAVFRWYRQAGEPSAGASGIFWTGQSCFCPQISGAGQPDPGQRTYDGGSAEGR